jgi:hypothetical protein
MSELQRLAVDLGKASATIVRRARGAGAKAVDAMASEAQASALSQWTTYGRGMSGAAGTIRGRMSRNRAEVKGYVMGDDAAAYQEFGTVNHPPQAVLGPALDGGAWADKIGEAGEDIL